MERDIKKIFTVFIFMMSVFGIAQENEKIDTSFLKEVYQTYNTVNSYQMSVEVFMYDANKNLAYPKQRNYTIKSGNKFYIETQEVTTVQTSEHNLLLDHISKEVRYLLLDGEQNAQNKLNAHKSSIPNFSELESEIQTIEVNDFETKVVFRETIQFTKTVYTFNSESKLLKQVDYYSEGEQYGQPAHIKIIYTTTRFNEPVDETVFQLNTYLTINANSMLLTEKYQDYSIINNNSVQQ